jgi:hypothetical protein
VAKHSSGDTSNGSADYRARHGSSGNSMWNVFRLLGRLFNQRAGGRG